MAYTFLTPCIASSTILECSCYIVQDCAEHARPPQNNRFQNSVTLSMLCAEIPIDCYLFLFKFTFYATHYSYGLAGISTEQTQTNYDAQFWQGSQANACLTPLLIELVSIATIINHAQFYIESYRLT